MESDYYTNRMNESFHDDIEIDDNVNEIYDKLLSRATGNHSAPSLTPPALSVEFVKSKYSKRAYAGVEGSFAEVRFPPIAQMEQRVHEKYKRDDMFGYIPTMAADLFPAGYGERSALALEREDQIYQMKGAFITASLEMAKLRAIIDARSGDSSSIDRIFARLWSLNEGEASMIPHLHLAGSEATRIAALEDRAYHAISGHPAYSGGYRVDMATIAPDALGASVPLNWSRLRMGIKAIGHIQTSADTLMTEMRDHPLSTRDIKIYMDIAAGSQPRYVRGSMWEVILDQLMRDGQRTPLGITMEPDRGDFSGMFVKTFADQRYGAILDNPDLWIKADVEGLAVLVKEESQRALQKTITTIKMFEHDRALIEIEAEEDYDEFTASKLTKTFEVEKYKVARDSWRGTYKTQKLGGLVLPDIESHGRAKRYFNLPEIRESNVSAPVSVVGALHMSAYYIAHASSTAIPCYRLLQEVRDPDPSGHGKVSNRLRDPRLYTSQAVRMCGRQIFNEEFRSMFETLMKNLITPTTLDEAHIKFEIWSYVQSRLKRSTKCPDVGGWRELVNYLVDHDEGWILYFWVRVSLGRSQRAMSDSILAPIAAGQSMDFLTVISMGVRERASRWKAFYEAKYQKFEDDLGLPSKRNRLAKKEKSVGNELLAKYIPPHLRDKAMVAARADKQGILNRAKGLDANVYEKLVELQTKIKFFGKVKVVTRDRQLAVGMSDEDIRELFIELYQMRWYSLSLRIEKAKRKHKPLHLGPHIFKDHPWGEYIEEYPPTLDGFMEWTATLDHRGWTKNPQALFERVQKSIGELWGDIAQELQKAMDHIEQVDDCLADEQTQILMQSRIDDVLGSLRATPAIVLPVAGYIPPHNLPNRAAVLVDRDDQGNELEATSKLMTGEKFMDVDALAISESKKLAVFVEVDDDEGDMFKTPIVSYNHNVEPVDDTNVYLTLRQIWQTLHLDEVSDAKMRLVMGLGDEDGGDVDLDAEHLDPRYGPIVALRDRHRVHAMWKSRLSGIDKRLKRRVIHVHTDDM